MNGDPIKHWDERFAGETYRFGIEPNAFLVRQAHRLSPGGRVLAVADGEGRNGVWLAERGFDVVSSDGSCVGQAKAQALARQRGVAMTFELADLNDYDWPAGAYDAIAAIFIQFAGPALREQIFAGFRHTLKPGGLLLLEGYRPEQLAFGTGGPRDLENFYTAPMLREAFEDFEIVELSAYDTMLSEGEGHLGNSALIDIVARKPA